jgi:adenine C2-methylase RlmN of 23S rRNA A2503 and tRNA A37
MTFTEKRQKIITALESSGIITENISFKKDDIPREFPAAIVTLQGEKGIKPTSKRFVEIDYDIAVFLIVDVNKSSDPDSDILDLTNTFKSQYRAILGNDIPKIDYYPARADSGRKVRIAKVYTVAE